MSERETSTESQPTPGERRLTRPPSERYREEEARAAAATSEATTDTSASLARGVALAVVVAAVGAAGIVVLGGILTVTAGLIVVAAAVGWGVGAALRWGAGSEIGVRPRVATALVLALASVALGQLGLWQYANTEGGMLAPLDYLWDVFGPLVPLEFIVAGVAAWWIAR